MTCKIRHLWNFRGITSAQIRFHSLKVIGIYNGYILTAFHSPFVGKCRKIVYCAGVLFQHTVYDHMVIPCYPQSTLLIESSSFSAILSEPLKEPEIVFGDIPMPG